MTTEQTSKSADPPDAQSSRSSTSVWTWVWTALGVATVVAIGWNVNGITPTRESRNPSGQQARRGPAEPLLGYRCTGSPSCRSSPSSPWSASSRPLCGDGAAIGPHPYILMGLVTTIIVWQDPIMNWAPYAVYDPRLWHWPESWPWVSLAPTVEPFVVFGYVMFQFGPYFPAVWLLRKIQARRTADAFVWRHPLISLGVLIFIVGFIIDLILEVTMIQTGLYMYSAGDSIWLDLRRYTSPISPAVGVVVGHAGDDPCGGPVYRDDTGRTVSEKLAQRARIFPRPPGSGRSWSCSSSSTCSIWFTGSLLPPSSRQDLDLRGMPVALSRSESL